MINSQPVQKILHIHSILEIVIRILELISSTES